MPEFPGRQAGPALEGAMKGARFGEAELRFGLQPISVVVKKGHRLRVAIAGHDNGTFIRVADKGTPAIAVKRNKQHLSSIVADY